MSTTDWLAELETWTAPERRGLLAEVDFDPDSVPREKTEKGVTRILTRYYGDGISSGEAWVKP